MSVLWVSLLLVLLGVVLLYSGGEALVRGAAHLAIKFGIPPLIVGLTIVSFSTSMPELISSLFAIFQGTQEGDLALGNVVGSNIANIGLILGLTAMICPLDIRGSEIRREAGIMLAAAAILTLLVMKANVISRWEGAGLFCLILVYVYYQVREARQPKSRVERSVEEFLEPKTFRREPIGQEVFFMLLGIVLLVLGGYCLVEGALELGRMVGISERVLGLTVVALGTSLPELATSVVAALRKHPEMSIGNIVGSNVFNIFSVVGAVAVVKPIRFGPELAHVDTWIMLGFCALLMGTVARFPVISRGEGALMLGAYLAYCAYLFL